MALQSTLYRFGITLQHVDKGAYETLDLRLACHPSEITSSVVTRVLAYCFLFEDGIGFSKGGLSDPDEPALHVRSLDGRLLAWIDVGVPSAERLHKASKASPRVVVVTQKRPQLLVDALAGASIHRKDALELYALDEDLVAALDAKVTRANTWELTFTDGTIYATVDGASLTGSIRRLTLDED